MNTRTITLPNVKVTLTDQPSGEATLEHVTINDGDPIAVPTGRVNWRRKLVTELLAAGLAEEASEP